MKKIIEIVFVFFVSLTFTNCESSDCVEILQAESTCSNLPYLEFVVPMSKEDNFRNAEIMKEANNRVRPYLKIEDGHIELMLKSGKEINVSDEIFQIFVEGTKRNNTLLKEGKIYVRNGRLYFYTSSRRSFPRFKKLMPEADDDNYHTEREELPSGGWTETVVCGNENAALAYYEDYREAKVPLGVLLYYASKGVNKVIGGPLATAFEYACDLVYWICDKQEEAIYNAARSGGLKAVTTYDPLPQFPGGTTQMVTEIYDSKGNLLGLF